MNIFFWHYWQFDRISSLSDKPYGIQNLWKTQFLIIEIDAYKCRLEIETLITLICLPVC